MPRFRVTGATLGLALLAAPAFAQTTTTPGTAGTTPGAPHGTNAPGAPNGTTGPATPPAGTMARGTGANGPTGSLQKVHDEWRASKLVGATVYNDGGDDVGSIDDLLVSNDGKITNAVISVGGFIGIGSKLVSVPFDQLKFQESANNNKPAGTSSGGSTTGAATTSGASTPTYYSIVLPGATKDSVSKMPEFKYQTS